jgi:hypothetical protein
MSKIFGLLLLSFFFFLNYWSVFADEKIRIYSRSEWWADETYWYINSTHWKNILNKQEKNNIIWKKKWANFSQSKKNSIIYKNKIKSDKKIKQNNYLSNNFSEDIRLISYNKFDWKNKLAWPIWKTTYIKNIVIHHTQGEYKNSWDWIKKIHRYHSLNKQWWDIWYNFIIWNDWEIFEGRWGWDYTVWAHDTLNNRSTVWISIMWNYENKFLKPSQYNSLKKLIFYLTKKYWINLNKKIPYHKECFWNKCINWLQTNYYFPIVWHRDWKATACPWKNIYKNIIPQLVKELQVKTKWYTKISYLDIKKEKQKYIEKINNKYNWIKVKAKFNKLSNKSKSRLLLKLNKLSKYSYFDWKKDILYKKVYEELKN